MKRFFRFLLWLVGGIAGTIAIPIVILGLVYLTQDTVIGRYLGYLYGIAVYFIAPIGILASVVMAFVSLSWSIDKKTSNQSSTAQRP